MIVNINEIESANWQASAGGYGEVVVDIDDINQSIALILNTIKGSDPFRPTFGSDIFTYLDAPIDVAIGGITNAVKSDIETWESRINVELVTVATTSNIGALEVSIDWKLKVGLIETNNTTISIEANLSQETIEDDSSLLAGGTLTVPIEFLEWQSSTREFGRIEQGINDVVQSIMLILSTQKGSDPFRPTFGSDIWLHVDTPLDIAAPRISTEIFDAINTWETRIKVTRIQYFFQAQPSETTYSGIVFNIGWELVGNISGQTDLLVGFPSPGDGEQPTIFISILATELSEPLLTETTDQFLLIE